MKIIQFEPEDKFNQKKFIQLPFDLYRNNPNWIPPLLMVMRNIFNKDTHGFYKHGEAQFLLAMDGQQPVGRLVMLQSFNQNTNSTAKTGHFYLFESLNDNSIARELFNKGIAWVKERKIEKIYGPKGMTPMDGLGLLVRGYEHRPAFGMPYNPEYYADFLIKYGFAQVNESESGYLNVDSISLPEKIFKAAQLVKKRKGLYTLQINSNKDLRNAVSLLGSMYNAALIGSDSGAALTEDDLNTMAKGLMWIAQPKLVKIIMKDDQAIGFLLAYPDVSKALQATHGRIFPFGWMRILWEKSHTKYININGIGVADEYRGMAGTAVLFSELYDSVSSSGQFKHAEVIQIGIENNRMQRELRDLGIDFYKTHAMFELSI
ncbi:MAG: hypothetical protein U9R53_04065 [Chloroflexota bacterium]|nr:hypothetical protein [Chloroflexota bacterium]